MIEWTERIAKPTWAASISHAMLILPTAGSFPVAWNHVNALSADCVTGADRVDPEAVIERTDRVENLPGHRRGGS